MGLEIAGDLARKPRMGAGFERQFELAGADADRPHEAFDVGLELDQPLLRQQRQDIAERAEGPRLDLGRRGCGHGLDRQIDLRVGRNLAAPQQFVPDRTEGLSFVLPRGGLWFFPDGSASGGELTVAHGDSRVRFAISGPTGAIRMAP